MVDLRAAPLTAQDFTPFGQVLDCTGEPDWMINAGRCGRYNDRAAVSVDDGQVGISLFQSQLMSLPYTFDLLERHPLGSQAFVPMCSGHFLVIVAPDTANGPGTPLAFVTAPGQGVNIAQGTWHGVLAPLSGSGRFGVIDRIGDGANLEEATLPQAITVTAP